MRLSLSTIGVASPEVERRPSRLLLSYHSAAGAEREAAAPFRPREHWAAVVGTLTAADAAIDDPMAATAARAGEAIATALPKWPPSGPGIVRLGRLPSATVSRYQASSNSNCGGPRVTE